MAYFARRYLAALLAVVLLLSCCPMRGFAEENADSSANSDQDLSTPVPDATEETAIPVEESADPTEETIIPTEESADPTEETIIPTEEPSDPTEETTIPTEDPADPTEETTIPTEDPADPTEETDAPAEEFPQITEKASAPPPMLSAAEPETGEPRLYFGQLHAHSSLSSGQEAPDALYLSAREAGMDFFAITDHSDSLARHPSRWTEGRLAAETATDADFLGIYGFEISWPERMKLGHISVFNTDSFQSWDQEPYDNYATGLQAWYETAAAIPGAIGQWNHPGNQYGTFSDFGHHCADTDRLLQLMEVCGTAEGFRNYTRALDKGWHVAPTDGRTGRTAILASALSEEALYEAIGNFQVYATEDADLEIIYTMNGAPMGSMLKQRHLGETARITADLFDPTDSSIGLVEVITSGGTVAAQASLDTYCDTLQFSLPADSGYCYLRITQPDGDTAVTAPIWIEEAEELGLNGLSCRTAVPVQSEETTLVLELHNRENADFLVDSLRLLANGSLLAEDSGLTRISAESNLSHEISFIYDGIGPAEITAVLSGTLDGEPIEDSLSIQLSFRLSQQVTDILVDGSHGNAGLSDLNAFKTLAAEEDIRVTIGQVAEETLKTCRFLLVSAPSQPFSTEFLTDAAEYVRYGGSLLVCGQSAALDSAVDSSGELNRLLEAVGSTLRLNSDTLTDSLYNGGDEALLFLNEVQEEAPWCSDICQGQVYRHTYGCSVEPGKGTPLIQNQTAAALAWEETEAGGAILAAGSLLLGDTELAEPVNIWDLPYANYTITKNLLGIGGDTTPLSTIRQAREAEDGTLLRIRGYVTAGTANSRNRFPDTLYLQDETGGIAVIPFTPEDIAVGTPVEITGVAATDGANRSLTPISWQVLDADFYRYLPQTGSWNQLLDPRLHGGELVEVEGECTQVLLTEGRVSGIALKDGSGNTAHLLIEKTIFSAATGENDLHEKIHKGDTVRAAGILHVEDAGKTVIRIRNCEEVVYIPPKKEPEEYVNPKTGDWLAQLLTQQKRRG